MKMPALPRHAVQAAGVRSLDEARMLRAAGVDMVGFPLRLDVHAPDIGEAEAREIVAALSLGPAACLITYLTEARTILELARFLGAAWVQLHAPVPPAELAGLRRAAPEIGVIKSLVVRGGNLDALLAEGAAASPFVDAFITDTFDPATGASGATGRTHDWAVSAALARVLPRPLLLAGGLTPDNVAAAVARVRPCGVDAHTGLEDAAGNKDPDRIRAFVRRAKAALRKEEGRAGKISP